MAAQAPPAHRVRTQCSECFFVYEHSPEMLGTVCNTCGLGTIERDPCDPEPPAALDVLRAAAGNLARQLKQGGATDVTVDVNPAEMRATVSGRLRATLETVKINVNFGDLGGS